MNNRISILFIFAFLFAYLSVNGQGKYTYTNITGQKRSKALKWFNKLEGFNLYGTNENRYQNITHSDSDLNIDVLFLFTPELIQPRFREREREREIQVLADIIKILRIYQENRCAFGITKGGDEYFIPIISDEGFNYPLYIFAQRIKDKYKVNKFFEILDYSDSVVINIENGISFHIYKAQLEEEELALGPDLFSEENRILNLYSNASQINGDKNLPNFSYAILLSKFNPDFDDETTAEKLTNSFDITPSKSELLSIEAYWNTAKKDASNHVSDINIENKPTIKELATCWKFLGLLNEKGKLWRFCDIEEFTKADWLLINETVKESEEIISQDQTIIDNLELILEGKKAEDDNVSENLPNDDELKNRLSLLNYNSTIDFLYFYEDYLNPTYTKDYDLKTYNLLLKEENEIKGKLENIGFFQNKELETLVREYKVKRKCKEDWKYHLEKDYNNNLWLTETKVYKRETMGGGIDSISNKLHQYVKVNNNIYTSFEIDLDNKIRTIEAKIDQSIHKENISILSLFNEPMVDDLLKEKTPKQKVKFKIKEDKNSRKRIVKALKKCKGEYIFVFGNIENNHFTIFKGSKEIFKINIDELINIGLEFNKKIIPVGSNFTKENSKRSAYQTVQRFIEALDENSDLKGLINNAFQPTPNQVIIVDKDLIKYQIGERNTSSKD